MHKHKKDCIFTGTVIDSIKEESKKEFIHITYHHLIDGIHDVQHLISSYVAIIVKVVKFKGPYKIDTV